MKYNVLVIGGTGKTGRKVVQNLRALGHNVRTGSRSGSPAFDWHQPNTWALPLKAWNGYTLPTSPIWQCLAPMRLFRALLQRPRQNIFKS